MLIQFMEVIGIMMLFFCMCMEECDGIVFVIQIVLVIGGALIWFAGYTIDRLKYERRQTDKRIAEMRRRMRELA